MKHPHHSTHRTGFTLMETVIAIGVLAVLLTAFIAVFAPAAQGIRKAISVQEADRLAYTLEQELTTLRDRESTDYATGFEKAYEWIEGAAPGGDPLFVYQYRGDPDSVRSDGTLEPYTGAEGVAGQDFIVQSMVRRQSDGQNLEADLEALEGQIYTVVLTQLVFDGGELIRGTPGSIEDPTPDDGDDGAGGEGAEGYPEAVIAFAAEFHALRSSAIGYIQNQFDPNDLEKPVFTRNLAVRR